MLRTLFFTLWRQPRSGHPGSRGRLALLATALVLAIAPAANAQSMDYVSLQQMFGEPVTTSATGKPQRASEAPVPMEIVTAEEIQRTGATSIPDALRHVLGVDVIQWSTEGADVSVRGFNSPYNPRLLVLLNGRQVYADHFGMVFWNTLPVQMQEIRQIEVVKGPNTALFGFNAAIGVINIVTMNPLYDKTSSVRVTTGTQEAREATAVLTRRVGDAGGITVSGRALQSDAFTGGDLPRMIPNVDPRTYTGAIRGQFRLDGRTETGFEASYANSERAAFVPMFLPSTPNVTTWSVRGSVQRESGLGALKAQVYFNSLDHDTEVVGFGRLNYTNRILVAQVEDLFKVGANHSFRISTEYRHNTYGGEFPASPFAEGVDATFDSWAGSAMWDWRITERLGLVGSGRVDVVSTGREGFEVPGIPVTNADFDKTITEFTFNAGLVWRAGERTRLRATAARGAKLMSLIEFSTVGIGPAPLPGMTLVAIGDPSLGAGIAKSYNLGVTQEVPGIASKIEVDGFYSSLSKNVTVANFMPEFVAPPFMVTRPVDVGGTEEYGVEAELQGAAGIWRWGGNYAYLDVNDDFDVFANGNSFVGADFERSTPKHRLNGHLGVSAGRLELDVYGRYYSATDRVALTGPTTGFALTPVGDLFTMDARAAVRVTRNLNVSVAAVGLNRQHFRESQADLVHRRVYASATLVW